MLAKNTLMTSIGILRAKEAVIHAMYNNNAISPNDISKAERLNYSQLFDPSINKMYFSLLTRIIIENKEAFINIFDPNDEDTIESRLRIINISRRCSDHSYTEDSENWNWNDFEKFRDAISWLENILELFE